MSSDTTTLVRTQRSEKLLGPLLCFALGAALAIAGVRGAPDSTEAITVQTTPETPAPVEPAKAVPDEDVVVSTYPHWSGTSIYQLQMRGTLPVGFELSDLEGLGRDELITIEAPEPFERGTDRIAQSIEHAIEIPEEIIEFLRERGHDLERDAG